MKGRLESLIGMAVSNDCAVLRRFERYGDVLCYRIRGPGRAYYLELKLKDGRILGIERESQHYLPVRIT